MLVTTLAYSLVAASYASHVESHDDLDVGSNWKKCSDKKEGGMFNSCAKSWMNGGRCAWMDDSCVPNCLHADNANSGSCEPEFCTFVDGNCAFRTDTRRQRAGFCNVNGPYDEAQAKFCGDLTYNSVDRLVLLHDKRKKGLINDDEFKQLVQAEIRAAQMQAELDRADGTAANAAEAFTSALKCHDDYDLALYLAEIADVPNGTDGRMYRCTYDYAEETYKAHSFVGFGQEAINCFDLPPFAAETAAIWHLSGCTPFKSVAEIAARTYSCVRHSVNSWFPGDEDILQRASKYAWDADVSTFANKMMAFLRRKVGETKAEFGTDMTDEWWDENVADGAANMMACFKGDATFLRSMQCLPSLWGRVGFGVGGLRNEGLVYRFEDGQGVNVESLRFNCQKRPPGQCKEDCEQANARLPMACARLAVASVAHFNPKPYSQNLPLLRYAAIEVKKTLNYSIEWCSRDDRRSPSNCMVFSQCAHVQLDEVCTAVPQCCSSEMGLQPSPEGEFQIAEATNSEEAEEGAAWSVGAEEVARKQHLFEEFGCEGSCASSFDA